MGGGGDGILRGRTVGLLTASASRLGGGVFEAVVAQAALIASLGGSARVFALQDAHTDEDRARFEAVGARVTACAVRGPRPIGYAPALVDALLGADLDALHLHGIWMYPSRCGAAWAARTGRPYFVSPHGMLDPWITARGRWKKALARAAYERASWRRATALHALTAREAQDIAAESGRHDSVVIPNAGPPLGPSPAPRAPDMLYIGRIHAKKNLVALVQGWRAARRPENARLTIAGWGEAADVAALEAAIAQSDGSVSFVGPVYGDAKQALLRIARFVVLPSHSEGLPMAILEAWAEGVPTIMTAECNLPEGFAASAALPCGYDAQAIAAALEQGLSLDDARWTAMARAAQDLAASRFSAQAVAQAWGRAYGRALDGQRGAGSVTP